jgi:UDP-glucose 4-epimerase
MKNILITGGAGFIGYALYLKLKLNKRNKIFILDLANKIKEKKFDKKCTILKLDISKKKGFDAIKSIKFETVYHLAAETSTYLCEINPEKCFKSNILGTFNLYDYCKKTQPRNIIFASSMAVYGEKAANVSENKICEPISFYGISKLIGEKIISKLDDTITNIKIFRLFNVYGPNQDFENKYQGMFSIYLSQIIKKKKISITGRLSRCRDFIYIDDVIRCLTNSKIIENKTFKILNLGTGVKTNIKKLILQLFKALKTKVSIQILKGHKGDTFISYANISKLRKLKWECKTRLKKGINKTIKNILYYYGNRSITDWKSRI